jgi:LPXTG-motif cell wall-anchored protein
MDNMIKTDDELPKTGSNSSPLITFATILLMTGLVIVSRRRITS